MKLLYGPMLAAVPAPSLKSRVKHPMNDRGNTMSSSTQLQPPAVLVDPASIDPTQREAIFDVFRRWGYLQAWLDPLGQYLPPEPFPVPTPVGPLADEARSFYSSTFGIEFMHIPSQEQRLWLAEQVEQPTRRADQPHVLTQSDPRRHLRAGDPVALSGHQALFAGRPDRADSLPR